MQAYLNRNGVNLERRKIIIQAFSNLVSKVELRWDEDSNSESRQQMRRRLREEEARRIQIIYEETIQKRLQQRYRTGVQSFQIIPELDSLNQQIEHFNQSKVMSEAEINGPTMELGQQLSSPQHKLESAPRYYNESINREYTRLNEMLNGDYPRDHYFRNAMPDKLQNFLRRGPGPQRQRPLRMSLQLNRS